MAGRPPKQGLDFFYLNVNFFSDLKVRKIARACGPNSATVLISLLCNIYKKNGYYILWDDDLPFVIADEVGVSEGCVREIILKALQVGFFDVDKHSAYGILTSEGIQKRFFRAASERKEIQTASEYLINPPSNAIFRSRNPIKPPRNEQRKEKEIKEISTKVDTKKDEVSLFPEPAVKKSRKQKGDEQPLQYPFNSDKFVNAWNMLLKTPKWRKKLNYALQLSLNKLARYDEEFAIMQIERAIECDWTGVVFDSTDRMYREWKSERSKVSTILRDNSTEKYDTPVEDKWKDRWKG